MESNEPLYQGVNDQWELRPTRPFTAPFNDGYDLVGAMIVPWDDEEARIELRIFENLNRCVRVSCYLRKLERQNSRAGRDTSACRQIYDCVFLADFMSSLLSNSTNDSKLLETSVEMIKSSCPYPSLDTSSVAPCSWRPRIYDYARAEYLPQSPNQVDFAESLLHLEDCQECTAYFHSARRTATYAAIDCLGYWIVSEQFKDAVAQEHYRQEPKSNL